MLKPGTTWEALLDLETRSAGISLPRVEAKEVERIRFRALFAPGSVTLPEPIDVHVIFRTGAPRPIAQGAPQGGDVT